MSPYLTHMQAEAHVADLREQAARRARPVPIGNERSRRLRTFMARVLLGLAIRLDHRLRPIAVRPAPVGGCG